MPLREACFLRDLAASAPGNIVEIGCYRGRSTIALATGLGDDHSRMVYSIDPHREARGVFGGSFSPEDRVAYYRNMLGSNIAARVALINLPSGQVARCWEGTVGMLFIDGDHRYEAVRADAEAWLPHVVRGGIIAFDDAGNPENGPARVVTELLRSGRCRSLGTSGKVHALSRSHA